MRFADTEPFSPPASRLTGPLDEFCEHAECSLSENSTCQSESSHVAKCSLPAYRQIAPNTDKKTAMELDIGGALKRRKMTQTQLAEHIGVSRGYLSELVSGKKKPSMGMLDKIIDALDADPAEIYRSPVFQHPTFVKSPAPIIAGGFSETAATPYTPKSPEEVAYLTESAAPEAPDPLFYRCSASRLDLALLAHDILAIDTRCELSTGDIVLVTFADIETGSAHTELSRWIDGWLVGPPSTVPTRHDINSQAVAVLGVVCGSVRSKRFLKST